MNVGSITNIDDRKPHVCVSVDSGDVHVVPVSLIEDWASGSVKPDYDVLKAIIAEWLSIIGKY